MALETDEQYQFLGNEEKFTFLYNIRNWEDVKNHGNNEMFVRKDLQYSMASGQAISKLSHVVQIGNEKVDVTITINNCTGCKKCPVDECKYCLILLQQHGKIQPMP